MEDNENLQEKIANAKEDITKISNIYISVEKQSVTLKGVVKSYDEKEEVEDIAWNTHGVVSVNNELSIHNEN